MLFVDVCMKVIMHKQPYGLTGKHCVLFMKASAFLHYIGQFIWWSPLTIQKPFPQLSSWAFL